MEIIKHSWRKSLFLYKNHFSLLLFPSNANKLSTTQIACLSKTNSSASSRSKDDAKNVSDDVSNAIGVTDELSSFIGLAREFACQNTAQHPYVDKLKRVQMILFDIHYAISKSSSNKKNSFNNEHTKDLEEWIEEYATQLSPPEDYIIPGGGKASASLHVARTICKRAERSLTPLVNQGVLHQETQIYLNRLSEFLFTVSRIAAQCDGRNESIYIPPAEVPDKK